MKNLASLFGKESCAELEKRLNISLLDEHDYTKNELEDLYDAITENHPLVFDEEGVPDRATQVFEDMITIFTEHKLIEFPI